MWSQSEFFYILLLLQLAKHGGIEWHYYSAVLQYLIVFAVFRSDYVSK